VKSNRYQDKAMLDIIQLTMITGAKFGIVKLEIPSLQYGLISSNVRKRWRSYYVEGCGDSSLVSRGRESAVISLFESAGISTDMSITIRKSLKFRP
jgi:hypothetical protein